MEPGINQLRETYSRLSDIKIMKIASDEAATLRPEALEILKQEVRKRGLDKEVLDGIDAQVKEVTYEELADYCDLLRNLPCPYCNSKEKKLNATMTATTISFIVLTNYEKELKVACPDCLDKENNSAAGKSIVLGWWGFPWGIIKTIQAIVFNNRMKKQNHTIEPNDLFKAFVLGRIGRIEANKKDVIELESIIKNV